MRTSWWTAAIRRPATRSNLTAAPRAVTANLADNSIPTNATITGYGGTVTLVGVEVVNAALASQALTVVGTAGDDTFDFAAHGGRRGHVPRQLRRPAVPLYRDERRDRGQRRRGGFDQLAIEGTAASDAISLSQPSAGALNVGVNALTQAFTLTSVEDTVVERRAGNDTLTVDSSTGLVSLPAGIRYNGGDGMDALHLTQTGGLQTSNVYSVGPTNGEGTSVITGASGTQTVYFENLSPVVDTVPATTLTVNATPSANAINYAQGSVATNALITIDNQESIEFSAKTNLVLNALAGSDEINLERPDDAHRVDGLDHRQRRRPDRRQRHAYRQRHDRRRHARVQPECDPRFRLRDGQRPPGRQLHDDRGRGRQWPGRDRRPDGHHAGGRPHPHLHAGRCPGRGHDRRRAAQAAARPWSR